MERLPPLEVNDKILGEPLHVKPFLSVTRLLALRAVPKTREGFFLEKLVETIGLKEIGKTQSSIPMSWVFAAVLVYKAQK